MSDTSWNVPDQRLLKELKKDEWKKLSAIKSVETLTLSLDLLKKHRQGLGRENTWNRLSKIINLMKPVAQAADVLAQGICLPSNTLWGVLGLIVDVIGSKAEILDNILHAYESLLSVLPRVTTFTPALAASPNLKLAIADVYAAYTTLSLRSLKTFGRGHRLASWNTFIWMRDRKLFQNSILDLEGLVHNAQQEAGYALLEQRQAGDSSALHEVVKNTENILSALSISDGRPPQLKKTQIIKFTIPPSNSSFVGRERKVDEIHTHLRPSAQNKKPGAAKSVILCGLGGVGKTQLALEYAHQHKSSYEACFWITCDSAVKTADGFSEVARVLDLGDGGAMQNIGNVKDWLRKTDETWLLIFDNAESPSHMADFWPQSSNGAILLTTQDTSWLSQEYVTHGFQLESLNQIEGVNLIQGLFARKQRTVPREDAIAIFEETGGLPLAMRQISSYILAENLSTTQFLKIYRSHRSSKTVDAWDESTTPWYSHTLATFLDVAYAKLSPRAISMLGIIAFLDVDKIQEELLCHQHSGLREGDLVFDNPLGFDSDISKLCRYSLISKTRDQNGIYLTLHRQVKKHLINRLTMEQLEQGATWTIYRLRYLFPRQSPFSGELDDANSNCALCIKHLLALRSGMRNSSTLVIEPEILASLYLDSGIYLWAKGLLEDGKAFTSEAKTLCDNRQVGLSMAAQTYSFHASILSDSGELEKGLDYFQKSLDILKRHLTSVRDTAYDTDQALLANAWNNLGGVFCALGDYNKAEMYNEIALRHKQKLATDGLPMSHLLCLSYQNVANTYAGQRRYDDAAEYFEKAIKVATLEESASRRALTSHNFGIMRLVQDKVGEARQLFEIAYQLRAEKIGDHPDTAASLHMLASCYHRMADEDSLIIARYLLQDSIRILKGTPSIVDKSRMARTLFKLSLVQQALKDGEATESGKNAGSMYMELTGRKTPPITEEEFDVIVPYI